jgi:hypothetical protein
VEDRLAGAHRPPRPRLWDPPEDPTQGIPLGNGDAVALAWCEGSRLVFDLRYRSDFTARLSLADARMSLGASRPFCTSACEAYLCWDDGLLRLGVETALVELTGAGDRRVTLAADRLLLAPDRETPNSWRTVPTHAVANEACRTDAMGFAMLGLPRMF